MTDNKKKEIKDYIKLYENLLFEILVGRWEIDEYVNNMSCIVDENYIEKDKLVISPCPRFGDRESNFNFFKDYKKQVGQRIYESMQEWDNRYRLTIISLCELEYTSTFLDTEYSDMYHDASVLIEYLMPIANAVDSSGVSDMYWYKRYGNKYTFVEIYSLKLLHIYNKYHQKDNFDLTGIFEKEVGKLTKRAES